jgi:hypothetical protein
LAPCTKIAPKRRNKLQKYVPHQESNLERSGSQPDALLLSHTTR